MRRKTCSIGVAAIVPEQNIDSQQLLKTADDVMYQAKAKGQSICIFHLVSLQSGFDKIKSSFSHDVFQ
ncbi:MAG: diguanylate cyclase [Colwellia sp.]|nr:diguanylate cyclase [Colwellia sp.]